MANACSVAQQCPELSRLSLSCSQKAAWNGRDTIAQIERFGMFNKQPRYVVIERKFFCQQGVSVLGVPCRVQAPALAVIPLADIS